MNEMTLHGIGAVQENGGHVFLWSLLTSSKCHVHWKEGGGEPVAGGSDGTEVSSGALAFPPTPARAPLPAPARPCHVGPPPRSPAPDPTPPPAWAASKPQGAEQGNCGAESSLRSRM